MKQKFQVASYKFQEGFSLVELLVAAAVFTFVVSGASGLFVAALNIQRRAIGIQKIEENVQFALESIAREVRVSAITSPDNDCSDQGLGTSTLTIEHPTNGTVTYRYDTASGVGGITRDANGSGAQLITSSDVNFTRFAFCISGSGADDTQARVTMPIMVESVGARAATRSVVSLQTTVVSRNLSQDLTQ
jgi:prepilin-type N-terminal cleavage/methylation domain-containing protein